VSERRPELLQRADELLLRHERDWLGDWYDRLLRWEFRRGFVHAATVTANTFLSHGNTLFQAEPIYRLGFVDDQGEPLAAEAVGEVVAHPAFGNVQSLDILGATPVRPAFGRWHPPWQQPPVPVDTWLRSLAAATHVTRFRAFVPAGDINLANEFNLSAGLDDSAVEAFCRAPHLRTLSALHLSGCPIGSNPTKDRLAWLIAEATFARRLRRLDLAGCRLTDQAATRIATDPVFSRLRRLDLSYNRISTPGLEGLFHSATLGRVTDVTVQVEQLPLLSRSPLAGRVRGLTVCGVDRTAAIRRAWRQLIRAGASPTRLHLSCHDPGVEILEALRTERWLRRLRSLAIQNDSQSDGLFHVKAVWHLLRSNAAPRLTRLLCHEFASPPFVAALARWAGLRRLEQLVLTDDYYGRLNPALFASEHLSGRLRRLQGIRFESDEEVVSFTHCDRLTGLREVQIAFLREISPETTEQLFHSSQLRRVETLWLQYYRHDGRCRELSRRLYDLLSNPGVLPRLRTLVTGVDPADRDLLQGVRRRLGAGLNV
jgi:hypothetical protein